MTRKEHAQEIASWVLQHLRGVWGNVEADRLIPKYKIERLAYENAYTMLNENRPDDLLIRADIASFILKLVRPQ